MRLREKKRERDARDQTEKGKGGLLPKLLQPSFAHVMIRFARSEWVAGTLWEFLMLQLTWLILKKNEGKLNNRKEYTGNNHLQPQ